MRIWIAFLATCLLACGGGGDVPGDVDGGDPDAAVAPPDSDPLYAPDHVVEIDITMAPADWDALRNQTRTFQDVLEGDCLAAPIESPFTTFPGAITVDGTHLAEVGLHKKGFFGSLNTAKPSLKVTFDEYVPGQAYLGLDKLTLNNANQDPSYLRQCLTYEVFAAAGVRVPRCNFAHVRVNGADLGIYVDVETVNHDFTRRVYADGSGNLYEGTLSDFRTDWVHTFDPKGDADGADLLPVVDALAIADDTAMLAALDDHLDLDRFYTYWAMEVITAHWDGYANDKNNYYVYDDPTTGQLDFIPWGVDATFQPGRTFGGFADATSGPNAVAASGALANRLFSIPSTRATFLARERALLASVWDEATMNAELDRMEALIAPVADQVGDPGWHAAVDEVRSFVAGRRALLSAELDAGPTWPYPLDGYPCLDVAAVVDGTFSTTYGTLGAANPFATGTGTMTIEIGGTPTTLTPIGATAGRDPNPAPGAPATELIEIFGSRAGDNHVIVTLFSIPQGWLAPAGFDVGFFGVFGLVLDYDPATGVARNVGTVFGRLQLGQAAATASAPIVGSFHGNADVQGVAGLVRVPQPSAATFAHLRAMLGG
jgi:hypothetical protein